MSVTNLELAAYYFRKGTESALSRALRPVLNKTAPWTLETRPEPNFDIVEAELEQKSDLAEVRRFMVDLNDFREWAASEAYPALAYLVNKDEKILEHYVSYVLLGLKAGGTVIDVASCRSFFPDILRRRGFRVIAQDLSYPEGLHGDRMGGDAAAIDLPEGSVAGMTLHCSFEHFEGDADIRFVRNVAHLLKPGGRVVILPLYLSHIYCVETDPLVSAGRIPVDEGAKLVASFGYGNRHGRHYSVDALIRRVLRTANDAGLKPVVYIVQNTKEISPQCYLRYALVLERPELC